MRHTSLLVAVLAGALVAGPFARSARAQWAVFDGANVKQTIATAINTAKMVSELNDQLRMAKQSLDYQVQSLRTLNPRSFSDLMGALDQGKLAYGTVTANIDSIGWSLGQVDRNFTTLFPKDKNGWKAVKTADFDNRYSAWNAEVTGSSLIAMRTQTQLASVERSNAAALAILRNAQTSDGEIRLLQGITQILGVMQAQLSTMIQLMSTTSRVLADTAAAGAGTNMLTREAKQRRRDGYRDRGRPAEVLTRMP